MLCDKLDDSLQNHIFWGQIPEPMITNFGPVADNMSRLGSLSLNTFMSGE